MNLQQNTEIIRKTTPINTPATRPQLVLDVYRIVSVVDLVVDSILVVVVVGIVVVGRGVVVVGRVVNAKTTRPNGSDCIFNDYKFSTDLDQITPIKSHPVL